MYIRISDWNYGECIVDNIFKFIATIVHEMYRFIAMSAHQCIDIILFVIKCLVGY